MNMVVGISLVGIITATIAAWFLDQTSGAATAERADLAERLQRMEATLAEIHAGVLAGGPELPARTTNGQPATPARRVAKPGCTARSGGLGWVIFVVGGGGEGVAG